VDERRWRSGSTSSFGLLPPASGRTACHVEQVVSGPHMRIDAFSAFCVAQRPNGRGRQTQASRGLRIGCGPAGILFHSPNGGSAARCVSIRARWPPCLSLHAICSLDIAPGLGVGRRHDFPVGIDEPAQASRRARAGMTRSGSAAGCRSPGTRPPRRRRLRGRARRLR